MDGDGSVPRFPLPSEIADAPGASVISEGSGNLDALAFPSIKPSSRRVFAQVRTADAGIAGRPDQWRIQPFRPAGSWAAPQTQFEVYLCRQKRRAQIG